MASRANTNRIIDEVGRSIELVREARPRRSYRAARTRRRVHGAVWRPTDPDCSPDRPTDRPASAVRPPLSPIHHRPAAWLAAPSSTSPSNSVTEHNDNNTHAKVAHTGNRASDNQCSSTEQYFPLHSLIYNACSLFTKNSECPLCGHHRSMFHFDPKESCDVLFFSAMSVNYWHYCILNFG